MLKLGDLVVSLDDGCVGIVTWVDDRPHEEPIIYQITWVDGVKGLHTDDEMKPL